MKALTDWRPFWFLGSTRQRADDVKMPCAGPVASEGVGCQLVLWRVSTVFGSLLSRETRPVTPDKVPDRALKFPVIFAGNLTGN